MNKIRIITEDLPGYKFPYVSNDTQIGYSLIQARGDDDWEPRWCLIDMIGTVLAIIEADSFDGLTPEDVSREAANFIMELHGLGEEDVGARTDVRASRQNGIDSYSYNIIPGG